MLNVGIREFLYSGRLVTQIFIQVDGASFNDLSVGGQGVCRVNLTFKHPHIGDLGIKLKKVHRGQTISLIGAVEIVRIPPGVPGMFTLLAKCPTQPDIGIFHNGSMYPTDHQFYTA